MLGHLSNKKLSCLHSQFPFICSSDNKEPCEPCFLSKQKRLPFTYSTTKSVSCFDLIHVDIWGPISIPSCSGHRYFLTIVHDKSHFTLVYLMKLKFEAKHLIQNFVSLIETQFGTTIKNIQSDNGLEFYLPLFYASKDIIHQTKCVEWPQQNGVVERKNQHILGVARSLLFQSSLPKNFWHHAVPHAIYLINRLPSPYLSHNIPYTVLHNIQLDFSHLKVFGCLAYTCTKFVNRTKLNPKSHRCVHLGYKHETKGYLLFDLTTRKNFLS